MNTKQKKSLDEFIVIKLDNLTKKEQIKLLYCLDKFADKELPTNKEMVVLLKK